MRMFRIQSINQVWVKIKAITRIIDRNEVYIVISLILIGIGGYMCGYSKGLKDGRPPVTIEQYVSEKPL